MLRGYATGDANDGQKLKAIKTLNVGWPFFLF